jgi:ATP-dependent helicase HrpB
LILLQPRRVAARAIAQRVAAEQHWTLGREVGWQVRFERRFGPETRLLVATEGILTARFQQDPLLSDFKTVVLDEFHERSIHGDLAITFAKQAWRARSDLRLVVMSATLDAEAVSSFLDGSRVDGWSRLRPTCSLARPAISCVSCRVPRRYVGRLRICSRTWRLMSI